MNGFAKTLVKLALEDAAKDKALRTVDKALPYATSGTAGGLGGLWLGHSINKLRPELSADARAAENAGKLLHSRAGLPLVLAALGIGTGLGTEKLRHMAREAKYKNVLKETRLETP